ncbi:hypothetical protein CORC01_07145, partial [Colletotrichum orchidophilum]
LHCFPSGVGPQSVLPNPHPLCHLPSIRPEDARGRQRAIRSHKMTRRIITASQAHMPGAVQMKQGFRAVHTARRGGERNFRWLLQIAGNRDLDLGLGRANASPHAQTSPKQLAHLLSSFAFVVGEMHGTEGQCRAFPPRRECLVHDAVASRETPDDVVTASPSLIGYAPFGEAHEPGNTGSVDR